MINISQESLHSKSYLCKKSQPDPAGCGVPGRSGQPRPEVEPPGQQPRVPRVRQQRRRVSRPGPRVT